MVSYPLECERSREFGGEIDPLVLGPARGVSPALDAAVADRLDAGVGRLVPATSVFEVDDDGGILGRRERIAVQPHARGGGHFGQNAVAGQRYGVVAGPGDLARAVGIGPETRRRGGLLPAGIGHLARDGHDRDVEQVADAGAGEVGVRESDHGRIALVVARAPVPLLGNARGPELHHAEGDIGADEDVTVAARADFRIDEAGVVVAGQRGLRAGCEK